MEKLFFLGHDKAIRLHIAQIFKIERVQAPWPQMMVCTLATAVPLLIGHSHGQAGLAVYGALAGFLVALNDHLGPLKHRLLVLSSTYVAMVVAIALGLILKQAPLLFEAAVLAMVYWIGLLGNEGGELERGAIFMVTSMIIMIFTTQLLAPYVDDIFVYSLMGFACVIVGTAALAATNQWPPGSHVTVKDSFRKALTWQRDRHIHALCYALTVLASIILASRLHWDRGYWVTITALLVMKRDRKTSVYVTLQRLIGTVLAVGFVDLLGVYQVPLLIAGIAISSFIIPWLARRNYLWVSFFITIFVLFLLDLAFPAKDHHGLANLRMVATAWGCLLSLGGTSISKLLGKAISNY